jgi:D-glycero-alpha-D-manno-heptose-7-phosphate kinase
MRITATAPCRIDLAGGTLDIPPLYLLMPEACTVNLAVNILAEVEIETIGGDAIDLTSLDGGINWSTNTRGREPAPPGFELAARAVRLLHPEGGVSIRTKSNSPAGAGIGASSALCVALVKGLLALSGRRIGGDELVRLCLDLEAGILGTPAGYQDFYASLNGGLQEIGYSPGKIGARRLETDLSIFKEHLMLVYTGIPHHSGLNNWEVFKAFIDGDPDVRAALSEIGYTAVQMAGALRAGDLEAVRRLLGREWAQRKGLWPGVTTPVIDALISSAEGLGGAGKACGAGGGGCVILWHDGSNGKLKKLREVILRQGAEELDWNPMRQGCVVRKE